MARPSTGLLGPAQAEHDVSLTVSRSSPLTDPSICSHMRLTLDDDSDTAEQ